MKRNRIEWERNQRLKKIKTVIPKKFVPCDNCNFDFKEEPMFVITNPDIGKPITFKSYFENDKIYGCMKCFPEIRDFDYYIREGKGLKIFNAMSEHSEKRRKDNY